ncbi:MAG: ABC transporter ATP-binding protein [Candidatus Thermoplasmatota archaeon]|nr:ABC transporter ATP-binding protein [Candidatus Thermoplasmatota archaeon]
MSSDDFAIEVNDLVKSYDGKSNQVDHLNFKVPYGEVYGLLGKNGAGKTTTIKILTTLIQQNSGSASICGIDVKKRPNSVRKIIGVVQQNESFDFTTVEKSFYIYGLLWEIPKSTVAKRASELMELFDLNEIRNRRMFELSGGQKKRVQVAREFIHEMKVLFLDEPTVGMDPIMRREILNYIREKSRDGLTVLFTTHILEEADYLCKKIGMINRGKMVAEGRSEELKEKFESMRKLAITSREPLDMNIRDKLMKNLSQVHNNIEFEVENKQITVIGKDMGKILPEVIQIVNSLSIDIDQVVLDNPSLDDVFIEVMKG